MQEMTPVRPDPLMQFPLVCRIYTPSGLVDLGSRLPRRGGVTMAYVAPEEVQAEAEKNGTTYTTATEAGTECPPDDTKDSETSTTTTTQNADGTTSTTTTNVKKTVNPDGSITTETTESKDGSEPVTVLTHSQQLARIGGVTLKIDLELGAEFGLIRPLTKLKTGDVVRVSENYTDRYALRIWQNAEVRAAPQVAFLYHAMGSEFYNVSLELFIVGATP